MQDPRNRDLFELFDDSAVLTEGGGPKVRSFRSGRGRIAGREAHLRPLEPKEVRSPDGRRGWRVLVPGGRPLATPAVEEDKVYLGGGFGSHEFYAFDAGTGNLSFRLGTKDDGPTAAAVSEGRVAFNTESCTIYVAGAATGRVIWEKWLGDPLLAQPAIGGSAVFMAYPGRGGKHFLCALGLLDGKTLWETEIIADVVTAPVIDGDSVYATTMDGTVYRLDRESGEVMWSFRHGATSAPWIHRGHIYLSLREEERRDGAPVTLEGIDTVSLRGMRRSAKASSRRPAEYLRYRKGSAEDAKLSSLDEMVGFAHSPSSAKLHYAEAHLGVKHVSSMWSFQGSRPEAFDDGVFSTLGDVVQRLEVDTKVPLWRSRLSHDDRETSGRVLNPPALTASRLYITSTLGDLVALDRTTGDEVWALNVDAQVISPPTVSGGKVFLGTADGVLYAFEADDTDPVGWPMWGGGPGHNGPAG